MGLFGKIFEKKECSVCGGEIGLLGNRKLEDGNLCKDCAKKLSPFFSERRHSTVEDIKAQLEYREANKSQLANFHPGLTFGIGGIKVYVDEAQGKFIVTRSSSWRNENPDIINISQVTSCDTDIKEHRRELYYKDKEGQNRSYNPPRYEFTYEFKAVINVNSPWFDDITVELSEGHRPENTFSYEYRQLEQQLYTMTNVLMGRGNMNGGMNMGMNGGMNMGMNGGMNGAMNMGMNGAMYGGMATGGMAMGGMGNNAFQNTAAQSQPRMEQPPQEAGWTCQSCGTANTGKFCQGCGTTKPVQAAGWTCLCGTVNTGRFCQGCGAQQISPEDIECSECSWTAEPGDVSVPAYCPNCGKKFDENDIR